MNQIIDAAIQPGVWEKYLRLGVQPRITSLAEYQEETLKGLTKLYIQIDRSPSAYVSVLYLLKFHRVIFEKIHPWAGQTRTCPQVLRETSEMACDPLRLKVELEMWELQNNELMEKATTDHQRLSALAFSHARLVRLNPFILGNGITARALMNCQLTALYGREKTRPYLAPATYKRVLIEAFNRDLTPFTNMLCEREGFAPLPEGQKIVAPYRIAASENLKTIGSVWEELELSKSRQQALSKMAGMMKGYSQRLPERRR